jgi:hypothetical protein
MILLTTLETKDERISIYALTDLGAKGKAFIDES